MYNVTFRYPAFNPVHELTIRAQLQGDTDRSPQEQVLLFTMDGLSLTRSKSKYATYRSNWDFKTVDNIEEIRAFLRKAEGEYIRYTHYDGSEWIIILVEQSYPVRTAKGRASYIENGERFDRVTHDFTLVVERWAAA